MAVWWESLRSHGTGRKRDKGILYFSSYLSNTQAGSQARLAWANKKSMDFFADHSQNGNVRWRVRFWSRLRATQPISLRKKREDIRGDKLSNIADSNPLICSKSAQNWPNGRALWSWRTSTSWASCTLITTDVKILNQPKSKFHEYKESPPNVRGDQHAFACSRTRRRSCPF